MERVIQNKINAFCNRGPLWTHSKREVMKLEAEIFHLDPDSALLAQLGQFLLAADEVDIPGTQAKMTYEDAFKRAELLIESSPEYAQLCETWSEVLVAQLKTRLHNEMPPEVVDKILDSMRPKEKRRVGWFNKVSLLELKQAEVVFRTKIKEIPLGVNYKFLVAQLFVDFMKESQESFVVLRANSIPELLDEVTELPHQFLSMPNVGDEYRGHFHSLFRWLGREPDPQPNSKFYTEWYTLTARLLGTNYIWLPLFMDCLPDPEEIIYEKPIDDTIEIAAHIYAALSSGGLPDDVVVDLMPPILYRLLEQTAPKPKEPGDLFLRKWLWGAAEWAHSPKGLMSHFSYALDAVVKWVENTLAPAGFVQAISNVVSVMGIAVHTLLDRLLELIFVGLQEHTNMGYLAFVEYFYASRSLISGLLPESRRRPKTVWALLFQNNFTTLTPAEKFALGCKYMTAPESSPDYYEWAVERLEQLRAFGADIMEMPEVPIRGFKLPSEPTVADQELAQLAPLMPEETTIHPVATRFVKNLHRMGVPPGMSGMWFGTHERITRSIARYDVDVVPISQEIRTVALRSAHVLADKFPSMYRGGQYLHPAAAINKIKVKYSPGLPFIPSVRNRKQLKEIGVFRAMVSLAEKYLQTGIHPGTMAHCFIKDDVVGLQKLLDGKNIRTVVAADLLSNLIQYCTSVEVTRRQPPIEAFIMNAVPRTEGGFRPFYEALAQMKDVIMADAKEFDSKLPPVISVDALAELRSLAYDGQLIQPIAESQTWATYIAMRHAGLIDLSTGQQMPHTQGLMTGQGNTGVDNRDAFRLTLITGWAMALNRDPARFWDNNIIGNAGDDDAIGTNEPEVWPKVLEWIRNNFGMIIEIEAQGFENLALVGLRPIPVPASSVKYYKVLGLPVPKFSIAGDVHALLAKRTEYRTHISRYHDIAFLMKHLDGIIGSAYLTAHLPDIYKLLADEYEVETTQILLRFYEKVLVKKAYDDEGYLTELHIDLGAERQRYQGKTKNLRQWLKQHRWPKYSKIMEIALRPQDVTKTKMHRDHSKILTWNPRVPYTERFLYGLIGWREMLVTGIPNHVARSLPEFKGLDPSHLMRNPNYPIAKFVWLSLYHKNNQRVPKSQFFLSVLKENPYGSAEDGVGFLNWLGSSDNLAKLTKENLEEYRAQMFFLTLVYWFVEEIFKSTKNLPILSILFNLYALTMRDINRLYSVLNYIHFLATGRSSPVISNMMPPDPYAWVKQFSAIVSILVPRRILFYLLPGLEYLVWPVPKMVEIWAAGDALVQPRPFRHLHELINIPAPWSDLVGALRTKLLDPKDFDPLLVVAPTGTGKSTAFIAALLAAGYPGTIWLLCPTTVARDAYDNPFLLGGNYQILEKGIPNSPDQRVKVLTYGHAINRLLAEVHPIDLLVFDEHHLGEMDMWRVWLKFTNKRVSITATPSPTRMPHIAHRFNYPGGKRFNTQVKRINLKFEDLISELATEEPKRLTRALIVVPSRTELEQVRKTLDRLSLVSWPLSREEPEVPPTGIIVATTIVDTAITITPPPTCLIDYGQSLKVEYDFTGVFPTSSARPVPTSPSTHTQRVGRVGRSGDSIAYVMPHAGTGEEQPPRVTPFGLLYDADIAKNMCSAYGVSLPNYDSSNLPGFLRFVVLSPDVATDLLQPHILALVVFIFIMHSEYQFGEDLKLIWLHMRLEKSSVEIHNIILDQIRESNFGDPLLGDWDTAIDYLASGIVGVSIGGVFYPCTGLCVINHTISPIGFDVAKVQGMLTVGSMPGALLPFQQQNWLSWTSFETAIEKFSDVIDTSVRAPFTPHPNSVDDTQDDMPLAPSYYSGVRMVGIAVRALLHKNNHRLVYFRTQEHAQFVPGPDQIKLVTNNHVSWPAVIRLPLQNYGFPEGITDLALAIIVATGANDDTTVIYGEPTPKLLALAAKYQQLGLVVTSNYRSCAISPRYARRWANLMWHMAQVGQSNKGVALIPKRILSENALERPRHGKYEVPVYLDQEDNMCAFV